jgi:hypothetical protein
MKKLVLLLLLLSFTFTVSAQKTLIKQKAQECSNALLKGDYNTVIKFTYPKILPKGKSKQQLLNDIKTGMGQMAAQGVSFKSVTIGQPGEIYTAGTELHALIPQSLTLSINGGTLKTQTNLLAISPDKGKTWYFMEAAKLTAATKKQLFPNWNSKLIIPPASQPQFSQSSVK